MSHKNIICLWYEGGAEDAARFYAETFPDTPRRRGASGAGRIIPSGKKGDAC